MSAGDGRGTGLGTSLSSGFGLDEVIGASLAHRGMGDGMRLVVSVAAAVDEDPLDEGGWP